MTGDININIHINSLSLGGLAGRFGGNLIDSYATGNIFYNNSAPEEHSRGFSVIIGGLVGSFYTQGRIYTSYAMGNLSSNAAISSFYALGNGSDSNIFSSYWNSDATHSHQGTLIENDFKRGYCFL